MEILYKEDKLLLEANKNAKKYLCKSISGYKIVTIWNDGESFDCSEHYNINSNNDIITIIDKNYYWNQKAYVYSFKTKKLYTMYKYNWNGVNIRVFKEHDEYVHNNDAKGIKLIQNYKNDSNLYKLEEYGCFIEAVEAYGNHTIIGEPGYPSYKEK